MPRFEEQHGGLRIFRQPARQDRACRAPTNDNNVIFHRAPRHGSSSFGMTSLGRDCPEYSTAWPRVAGWVWLQHAYPIAPSLAVGHGPARCGSIPLSCVMPLRMATASCLRRVICYTERVRNVRGTATPGGASPHPRTGHALLTSPIPFGTLMCPARHGCIGSGRLLIRKLHFMHQCRCEAGLPEIFA